MTNSIRMLFMWQEARPDNREFRQNSSMLVPEGFMIGIEIPRTAEYILNLEELTQAELVSGNKKKPDPIYTPKAIQFCLDKLGEYLHDPENVTLEDLKSDNLDWSSDEKDVGKQLGEALSDDWSDTSEPPTELPWDEEKEDWS